MSGKLKLQKSKWPENQVHYWNRLGQKATMAERSSSPFIGLQSIAEDSEDSYKEVERTQARYEAASIVSDHSDRPRAPHFDLSMNLPSPEKIMRIETYNSRDSVETIPAEDETCSSPTDVNIYGQDTSANPDAELPNHFQPIGACSTPNVVFPVPPFRMAVPTPPPIPIHMFHRATMVPPSPIHMLSPGSNHGYGITCPPFPPPPTFINTRYQIPTHPQWRRPILGLPYLSAVPVTTHNSAFQIPSKLSSSSSTQTSSGVLQNYLRPLHGPAGHPDSRIMCPACGREEWHVDIITKDNAIIPAPQPHGLLDARLTCKRCKHEIWQAELLTETYPYIYVPPVVPRDASWTNYDMPSHPPHVNMDFSTPCNNGVETVSPDSGVQCSVLTPNSSDHVTSDRSAQTPNRGQHGGSDPKELYADVVKLNGRRLDFSVEPEGKWISSFTKL